MATDGVNTAAPFVATPKSVNRRSARRSWFETPPATKLDIAVEKPPLKTMNSRSKRRSIDDVETLVLTHFTKPPRISFGKIVIGRSKTRILLVQNPADYEQEVVIERFPYKKCFNVDQTHFEVGPEEVVSLTLTWTPQEAGSCREMVLFHVNDVYRLQAYVFGTADDPKPAKKGRKGTLGTRRKQPLSCVVQTKSLKSIHDSYSPRKSDETRELLGRAIHTPLTNQENLQPAELDEVIPLTPPPLESTAICKSDERVDQNAIERRKSGFLSPTLSKMSPIPMIADNHNGRILESYFSTTARDQTPVLGGKEAERNPLKEVSGNGSRASNSRKHGTGNSSGGESGGENSKNSAPKGASSRDVSRGSRENSQTDKCTEASATVGSAGSLSSKRGNPVVKEAKGSPSPLRENQVVEEVNGSTAQTENPEVAEAKGRLSSRGESPAVTEAKPYVSPNSFLNDSMARRTVATTPEIGKIRLSSQVNRVAEMATVSPNSFLEDMGSAKPAALERKSSVPSPSAVLNDSIPHDIMLQQLRFVRRSLHDGSLSASLTPKSATVNSKQATQSLAHGKRMDRVSQLAQPKSRNVFAHAQQQTALGKKEKFLQRKIQERAGFAKIAEVPSPRRKTFLVTKKQQAGRVSPVKGQSQATKGRMDTRTGGVANSRSTACPLKGKVRDDSDERVDPCTQTTTKDPKKKEMEQAKMSGVATLPGHHGDQVDNLDDTMTRRRRSLWASPAVVGFEPPVMASKPDCDSTGEELHTLEAPLDQVTDGEVGDHLGDQHKETHSPPPQTLASTEKSTTHQNLSAKTESEEGRRRSGRRLFPDVISDDLNLSADFKPLWSGSATVTKDRPSVSPHTSSSANTSKKLFPDISVEGPSDVNSKSMLSVPQRLEEKEGEQVQPTVDSPAGISQPVKGGCRSSGSNAGVDSSASFDLGSTPQLLASPGKEVSRRATLTVTKTCPSQALLHASNNGAQAVAEEADKAAAGVVTEQAEEEVWKTDTIIIESRNNAIVNISVIREHLTPSELPSSPRSENSRRSTHAVRNPIVLNKDGLVPRNLFDAVPEQHASQENGGNGDSLRQAGTEASKRTPGATTQQTEDRDGGNLPANIQKDSSVMVMDKSLRFMNVFTDRVEHHLYCERETICRPTRLSAAEVILSYSTSSQELSADSLDAERRASSGCPKTDINTTGRGADHVVGRTGEDGKRSVAVEEGLEAPAKTSDADQKLPEAPMKTSRSDQRVQRTQAKRSEADQKLPKALAKMSGVNQKFPEAPAKKSWVDQEVPEASAKAYGSYQKVLGAPPERSGDGQKIPKASANMSDADQKFPEAPAKICRMDQKIPEVPMKTSGVDQDNMETSLQTAHLSLIPAADRSLNEPAGSHSQLEGQTKEDKTFKIQSQVSNMSEAVGDGEDVPVSQMHHAASSFPETMAVPSQTTEESQVDAVQASGPVSTSAPSDDPPREKLTRAGPILTHTVVRERLLKEGANSTLNGAVSSSEDRPAGPGQLKRSLSSDLRSVSHARRGILETKSSKQQARALSASSLRAQTLPRARSQNSLDSEKQSERPNRKRSSPEAGLKEPRSKRVELESRMLARKSQQPLSRAAPSRTKVERTANLPKGVALSRLILVKKPKAALPKHPLPFAAKNMYYDERWQDKQERGFVHWLNFVLTPADEYALATTKTKVDARSIAFDGSAHKVAPRLAPTKEVLSFRAYAARRRLNHLRRASCRLFQSEAVVRVVCRVELEVEQRRLAVRTDRMIHADIGIKQKILDMLLSYNPLWLRVGLETVYGEVLPIQSNNDVIGMSRFILTRLLTNPDISAQYSHPTVPHLYHDGYADAVAQHTMKKFLVLVYFLDCAKQSRLIAHDPCLFCKDAEIKSSKGMLVQFSRDYLSGEGDITKHLAYMGYVVSHAQTPLDEFDYAVGNLCTDLRDGLRLGRIVMLLSGDWSFAPSLRAPAISRLQKIHNVELVFRQLTKHGFDLKTAKGAVLNARDIVDGHREKTLAFLWKLIFHFQTVAMLNEEELREEVTMLERTLRVKLCMQKLLSRPHLSEAMARRDSGGLEVSMDNTMLQLLLKWCRTVCLHYGVKVENFTVSFSDGRALCCLLHHYHPALLPLDNVHFQTSQSLQEAAERAEEGVGESEDELSQDWGANQLGGEIEQSVFEKLLANEKENFKTLYEKVSELGGIPLMLKAADMSNTIPDERVVITYVSYMCTRLLDLREETRAARIIQLAWRRFCLRRTARLRQTQIAACIVIQRAWRQYLVTMTTQRREAAAVCLQALWRGRQGRVQADLLRRAKADEMLHEAAAKIQTFARCFLYRQRLRHQIRSAVIIQSWFRAQQARRAFARQLKACLIIQSHYRAHRKAAAVRKQFLTAKRSVVVIQRAYRLRRERVTEERNRAACTLQSVWRGKKGRREFLRQRRAAVCIQAWWRAECAQTWYLTLRTATTIIQRQFRAVRLGAETRREFLRQRQAAIMLQKRVRGFQQCQRFRQLKSSALVIQKNFRRYKCSVKFRALRLAAVIIQGAVRAHQARTAARRRFVATRLAAVTIQRWFRQQKQRQEAKRQTAAIQIQACFRGHLARKEAAGLRLALRREAAALTIQASYRAALARKQLRALQLQAQRTCAAVRIQAYFRGYGARKQARSLHKEAERQQAAVKIQSAFRRYLAVRELRALQAEARREAAALKIQSLYRRYLAVKEFRALQLAARREWAALKIQSVYRRYRAVKERRALQLAARKEWAATKIQSAYRGYLAVKELRVLQFAARRHTSAIKIQTLYRIYSARRHVQAMKEAARREAAATRIQAFIRGQQQCRRYQALQRSVLLLQTYARGRQARQNFKETQEMLVVLAEYQHTHDKFQAVVAEFHQRWNAAVSLQAVWRGRIQRQRFLQTKLAITRLQAMVRARMQRKRYLLLVKSATIIQRRFRAHRLGQATHLRYQLMLGAAVVIQSCWKGYVVRFCYLQLRAQVICAQAHCRRFLAHRRFQRQRQAALCLQGRFRARVAGKEAWKDYQRSRRAVIRLQAIVRGCWQRRRFLKLQQSCVKIQSAVKKWLAQRHYQMQRRAAVTLQRRWRASLLCREEKCRYTCTRKAVVTIQSYVRGHLARREVCRLHQAASVIQRNYRRCHTRRKFLETRQAAVTLQRRIRAFLNGQQQKRQFAAARKACITIQSAYRGFAVRKHYLRSRRSAITIQSAYRGFAVRKRYLRSRRSAITIQSAYRGFAVRKRYLRSRRSAITIQSAYRGFAVRKRYLRSRQSAITIQAAVRGFQQRQRYLAVCRAVAVCQNRYRAKCLGQVFRAAFLMIRDAAIIIQKHGRGYLMRKAYQRKRTAAILLQACARGWLQRRRFVQEKQAAVCIQRRWRVRNAVKAARAELLCAKQAAVTVQRSWRAHQQRLGETRNRAATVIQRQFRCFVMRRKFNEDVRKVTLLQAYVRGFLARRKAAARKHAVIQIQRRWRETLLTHQCRRNFLLKLGAAILIQSVFRGHRTRMYYGMAVERVVLLQAAFRGCLQRRRYRKLRHAVVSLQRRVRSNAVARQERRSFLHKRRSAVCIQRAFRHWQNRQMEKKVWAATCIQSYARMLPARRKFVQMRTAVITLQAAVRGCQARQTLLKKKSAIVYIQNRVRFFLLVRQMRQEVHRRRLAAVKIQRAFRKHQAGVLARKINAASKIQAAYRGFSQRKKFLRRKQAALTLQSAARGWRARRRAAKMRREETAALLIQTHFRAWRTKRQEQLRQARRAEYLCRYVSVAQRYVAAMTIQRWYRRCIMVREAKKQLHYVVLLQRRFRAFLQRVHYLRQKHEAHELKARQEKAARVIQSALRKWRMCQKEKRRVKLITMIQAIWRGRQLRRNLKCRKIAAARKRVEEANRKVTEEKKLGNRTTSALDFLLHYKQLAYILDALMHLDVATRLSWLCCERLVEVNAVGVIYRLILSCNRSLPHMELIKFSVSILLNLAKYEKTASAVYEVENSVTTLVDLMSIYREKGGAIFTKCCMLLAILGSDAQRKAEMCSDKRLVDKLQSIHALVLRKHRMQVARARVAARSSLNATLPSRLHAPRAVKVRPAWVLRRDSMQDIEDPLAALSFLLDTLHIGPK